MTSRQQGVLLPNVFRFRLGSFEVTNILDGAIVRSGLYPKFGANVSATEVQAAARANRLDMESFQHHFVATLVDTGRELMLFDTGNGQLKRGVGVGDFSKQLPDGLLRELLASAGYAADDIDVVVLTHGHPDHIGGLMTDGAPTFPRARYVFGAAEYDFWTRGDKVREARKIHRELFMKLAAPLGDRAEFLSPGQDVASGIRAIDASGHSPGQLAFLLESEGKALLMWADVAIHYALSLQHPDFQVDVDDDKDMAAATRRRILEMVAAERLWAVGSHMPFPSLGFVEKTGGGYRWVPHSYQLTM